ncbi:MAG: phosphoglucosamine mutase [Pirellulales bacterium]|nr:phosphoglucosamine mutase [Pirellulales bacterium]
MSEPIISVSGLRGIVGDSLTPPSAMRFACAFAAGLPAGPIVLARDGRSSGRMLADAIRGGLAAIGRTVIDADVAATPTAGVLVRQFQAAGGIMITASHNPPQYNGIKLFDRSGQVLTAEAGQAVIERYRAGEPAWAPHDRLGALRLCNNPDDQHLRLVEQIVASGRIQGRRYHVLLDSNHGAGSELGSMLLESLGCHVTLLGGEPDGQFEHPPEPTAENLASVLDVVRQIKADIAFCQDPDADRLAIIDEHGRYLGEEYTLALCVEHVLRRAKGPIVTNCSTSRMTQDLAARHGVPFYRSAVGEANVVAAMKAHGALFGGEGNGGVIDPRVGYVRDSFVGMALVLDAMALRELPISRLADELPRYEIVKTKLELPPVKLDAALNSLEKHFPAASVDRLDGLRLDWPDRWLLVRASNTEPIVRIIAEAPSRVDAQKLCDESAKALAKV